MSFVIIGQLDLQLNYTHLKFGLYQDRVAGVQFTRINRHDYPSVVFRM
jgi:hypothetical protein